MTSSKAALAQGEPSDQVADAKAALTELKQLPNQLKQAQANNEAADAAQEAADSAQSLSDQLQNQPTSMRSSGRTARHRQPVPPDKNPAMQPQAEAETNLAIAMEKFAPKVAEARETLTGLTPKLSELAKSDRERNGTIRRTDPEGGAGCEEQPVAGTNRAASRSPDAGKRTRMPRSSRTCRAPCDRRLITPT